MRVIAPAKAPATAQRVANFGSSRLIKTIRINTKGPTIAPITKDIPTSRDNGIVLNFLLRAMTFISIGVIINDGMYVGHSGVVNNPNNTIPTILNGLTKMPHSDGSRHTAVKHTTSGARVNIKIIQIMFRFIRIQGIQSLG